MQEIRDQIIALDIENPSGWGVVNKFVTSNKSDE